jgi:hypothetical protein
MCRGTVVTYVSLSGMPLRCHQAAMLNADARTIARCKGYRFGGDYGDARRHDSHLYFVPDDTLLADEARVLGIQGPDDLYGGVVPHPFVKTKAITHPLIDMSAERPDGWLFGPGKRISDAVLPGYTAFSPHDARIAAGRMLAHTSIRVKQPLEAGGRGQDIVATLEELDPLLERMPASNIATYGLVLEQNLQQVATLSIGHITVDDVTFTYHGRQRVTRNNEGRPAYGGSDLVCVRGGWNALSRLPLRAGVRTAIAKARSYDAAMSEYPGFMASRRNYDVGVGLDCNGHRRSGVFESSWRVGGATGAEVVALSEFTRDPAINVVETSHVEEFGKGRMPPPGAVNHVELDDPEVGPIMRYTVITGIERARARVRPGNSAPPPVLMKGT